MKKEKEMYEVIRILERALPNRNRFFFKEVNTEMVAKYKQQLLTFQEWLGDNYFDDVFFVSKERLEYLKRICTDELEICDFYLTYSSVARQSTFDKWVTIEEKERDSENREGTQREGKAIIKTNGKIKAVIEIKDNTTTTKITLSIQNDNKFLQFWKDRTECISERNLRNEKSINEEIEHLKEVADKQMQEHPYYSQEQREWKIYLQLVADGQS